MEEKFQDRLDPNSDRYEQPNTDSVERDGALLYLRAQVQTKDGQSKYMKITINRYTSIDEQLSDYLQEYKDAGEEIYEIEVEEFESVEEYKKGENARQANNEKNQKATDRIKGYIGLPMVFQSIDEHNFGDDRLLHQTLMQKLNIENLREELGIQDNYAGFIGHVTIQTKEIEEMELGQDVNKTVRVHYSPENLRNNTIKYIKKQDEKAKQKAKIQRAREESRTNPNALSDNIIE